jgi:peroxiredoxin
LEVWQDYAANKVNPAAAEWIAPTPETDGREPWVFVIDHNGIIVQRFDNVASDAELEEAVENVLTTGS